MKDRPRNTPHSPNQSTRRVTFGLNVLIATVTALALVVCVNGLAWWTFPAKAPYRIDLTATRRYSLSAQTRQVLDTLKQDVSIVTLIAQTGLDPERQRLAQQVTDLVDEYDTASSHITVEHITPGRELTRQERFFQALHDRFSKQLEPVAEAVEQGQRALDAFSKASADPAGLIKEAAADPALTDDATRKTLREIAQAFGSVTLGLEDQKAVLNQTLEGPLPNYQQAKGDLSTLFEQLNSGLLAPAAGHLRQTAARTELPASVRDRLLRAVDGLTMLRKQVDGALEGLRQAPVVDAYDQMVSQLAQRDVLVISSGQQVRVQPVWDLFRSPVQQQAQDPNAPKPAELGFLGEEMITGVLVSMTLENPPLVVFMHGAGGSPIGPGGAFNHVADRLKKFNFQVEAWSPMPANANPASRTPPQPTAPPQPKSGQKVVWIVLPQDSSGGDMLGAVAEKQLVSLVNQQLAAGDGVLAMLGPSPMAQFQTSAMAEYLAGLGMTVQSDRIILAEMPVSDQQTAAQRQHLVTDWPGQSIITQAIAGMPGVFPLACPILVQNKDDKATITPLVMIQARSLWAERSLDPDALAHAKFDPNMSAPAEGFTIGAAYEKDGHRLIVFSDPYFANDQITTYGQIAGVGGSAGLADLVGATFPGNAELFVNSVLWLADLPQLIAPSPRSQDIRRIESIHDGMLTGLRWGILLGLPLACLATGTGVWWVRRRG